MVQTLFLQGNPWKTCSRRILGPLGERGDGLFMGWLFLKWWTRGLGSENREKWMKLRWEKKTKRERANEVGLGGSPVSLVLEEDTRHLKPSKTLLERSFPKYECNGFICSFGFLLFLYISYWYLNIIGLLGSG